MAWMGAVGAGLLLAGGSAWWLLRPASPPIPAAAPATEASAPASTASGKPPPGAAEPAPEQAAVAPRDAIQSLAALRHGATPGFEVTATGAKSRMQIGKDRLEFQVSSNRPGHVYAFLLSSDGHMYLLFPNSIDKRNAIRPGTSLTLPRASWPLDAGGPAGTDRFAVVVSEREREFTSVGIQSDGLFPQFPLPVLAALEATRNSEATPLLGEPVCPKESKCTDAFGVAFFEVEQY